MVQPLLKVNKIIKTFPGVKALSNVSLEIEQGEVHCIMGENGAGKSTLIKILTGVYTPDSGEIYFKNEKLENLTPNISMEKGIAVVHQDLNVLDFLTVEENMTLGRESTSSLFISKKKNREFVEMYLKEVELYCSVDEKMGNLSVAEKQLVMIAKALSLNASLIILDEPTAMLSEKEVKSLFKIINKLKNKNVAVIYISHRMEEIFEIGNRITVLKDGCNVETFDVKNVSMEKLCYSMVGREIKDIYPSRNEKISDEILRFENVFTDKIKNISFSLSKGEVLGISGLVGSGRSEVLNSIFGADPIISGKIFLKGKSIKLKSIREAIDNKIVLIPEDRKNKGIVKIHSIRDNLSLVYSMFKNKFGFVNKNQEEKITNKYIDLLSVKTPHSKEIIGNLSGGNQQKIVLGKWLSLSPDILLLDEPTQGIDIGSKAEIYQLIKDLTSKGMAIIIVSSELTEVINLCHKVLVMKDKSIKAELSSKDISEQKIISYAMGVS